ncbi:MAG TPA: hypothetical protein VFZ32_11165 [Micromonosporaceae bacterium]
MSAADRLRFAGADLLIAFSSLLALLVAGPAFFVGLLDFDGPAVPALPALAAAVDALAVAFVCLAVFCGAALPAAADLAAPDVDVRSVAATRADFSPFPPLDGSAGLLRTASCASVDLADLLPDAFFAALPDAARVVAGVFGTSAFAPLVAFRAAPARSAIAAP